MGILSWDLLTTDCPKDQAAVHLIWDSFEHNLPSKKQQNTLTSIAAHHSRNCGLITGLVLSLFYNPEAKPFK